MQRSLGQGLTKIGLWNGTEKKPFADMLIINLAAKKISLPIMKKVMKGVENTDL